MIKRVLIIGGYGNFGKYISSVLAKDSSIQLIIAGRNPEKGECLIRTMAYSNKPEIVFLDINELRVTGFKDIGPDIVIHTSGPYQSQGYEVAEVCIEYGCHYIDLADAREFVSNISLLDAHATQAGVHIISGASSVPTLTSAIIDEYISEFEVLREVDYAISSAQLTNQGLATTQAILSYVGKEFLSLVSGKDSIIHGWQGLRFRRFWGLNLRALGNCNVPDLSLFPERYPSLETIKFQAGIESKIQHVGLFGLSWFVRIGLVNSLYPLAQLLLKISRWFDVIGTNNSGFYMKLIGMGSDRKHKEVLFEILAQEGDGLFIPCIPSILLTKKLVRSELSGAGASPCVGFLSLQEYLCAFKDLNISWRVNVPNS